MKQLLINLSFLAFDICVIFWAVWATITIKHNDDGGEE